MFVLNTIPDFLFKTFISQVLEITVLIFLPFASLDLTTFKSSISATPSNLTDKLFSSETFPAIPPTWKVLRVN